MTPYPQCIVVRARALYCGYTTASLCQWQHIASQVFETGDVADEAAPDSLADRIKCFVLKYWILLAGAATSLLLAAISFCLGAATGGYAPRQEWSLTRTPPMGVSMAANSYTGASAFLPQRRPPAQPSVEHALRTAPLARCDPAGSLASESATCTLCQAAT